jgi:hypothetical protein
MDLTAIARIFQDRLQQIRQIEIQRAPSHVLEWIRANPRQSALIVINGIIIFTPGAITGPVLGALGFGAQGPIAGEFVGMNRY